MADWPSNLTLRPIIAWPTERTRNRKMSQFSSPLRTTLKQLDKELDAIRAKDVVMQIALEEAQFRNDGYPRAGAIPEHPGVILSMHTKDGALSFPCDTFTTWQDNLRAIVLTMERFRGIARYGVTKNGQEYAGFRAIEGARAMPSGFMDSEDAIVFLRGIVGGGTGEALGEDPDSLRALVRFAQRAASPDHGGDTATMTRVNLAQEFLREANRL